MTVNPNNDILEVFEREDGRYDWRRRDGKNREIVATSGGQGYESAIYAGEAAAAYNWPAGMKVVDVDE